MAIIDCAQVIEPHWRWRTTTFVSQCYAEGDEFQEFGLSWDGTGFSFSSAPGWHRDGAPTLDDLPVSTFAGVASVVDLSALPRITRHAAAAALVGRTLRPLVVLRTGQGDHVPIRRRSYWTTAPVIEADVADLLAERGCRHVVVDVSLESLPALRADGRFGHDNASEAFRDRAHAHGLVVTENARNLGGLADEVFFAALPLRGRGLTTAPCRPIAMDAWPSNGPEILDLSMPLENHWRWYLELDRTRGPRDGRWTDETRFVFTGHGFTHCDAPRHMERDGPTIQDLPNGGLDLFCGPSRIAQLDDLPPATAITADLLEARLGRPDDGAMIVLWSGLTDRLGYLSRRWHLEAPWLDVSAAEWLAARRPAAVVLDFPQDRVAREMPDRHVYNREFVAHHAILGAGIPFVEDLRDIGAIGTPETWLLGVPLRTACIDGAPMRVVAVRW